MDNPVSQTEGKERKPIDILRDRHGGMSDALKQYFKEQNQVRKAFTEAFKQGALTVPELAERIKLDPSQVLWHVMAMKKYGLVQEYGEKGDYPTYNLAGKE
jgi:predicted transcriptional regulator